MKKENLKQSEKSKTVFDYQTIKSFEDACKKESIDPANIPDVSMVPEGMRKAILNVFKLFVIFQAINDGWTPDWHNHNQYKYLPWLEVKASKARSSGFGFSRSGYGYTAPGTGVGSRLCTNSSEKALYIGKTFQDEYKEFFLITQ